MMNVGDTLHATSLLLEVVEEKEAMPVSRFFTVALHFDTDEYYYSIY